MNRLRNPRKWKRVTSKILDQDGTTLFEMKNIKAPESWSQNAIDIAASKYLFKGYENSIEQLVKRICMGLSTAYKKSGLFSAQEIKEKIHFIEEAILDQRAAFNSPVWFNCGLYEAYQLNSYSEQYAYNYQKKKVEKISNAYARPQGSACFIQSVEDNMESIFDLLKSESRLFRYGSGTGSNFSNLRSKYEKLKNGGYSSGLISFLEIFDKSAGAIKSGGTTRRAAKMVCLDADHPEILDFITWKQKEEQKAKALIKEGYSASLDGEVYRTISGQNSNNSVRLTDSFVKKYLADESWNLNFRSGKVYKKIKAKELWDSICQSAWDCADPGVQFDDTINKFHTCKESGKIRSSNPCSEFMFLDDTACNLASINLIKFFNVEKTEFDLEGFLKTVETFFEAQEALVDYASYPTEKIAQNSHDYRPLGMGFTNLGGLLMLMGIAYDSEEARAWAGFITSTMTAQSYKTSSAMAKKIGPFPGYKKNKKSMKKVLDLHAKANQNIAWALLPKDYEAHVKKQWKEISNSEFRNAQATVIAPTGTIGLVMDCVTTGIEPEYSLMKMKKLSGGGVLEQPNSIVSKTLEVLGYSEEEAKSILDYLKVHRTFKNCKILKEVHHKVFQTAQGDDAISADGHLLMMAAVQPFISGAISKTVNLKVSTKVEEISEVYLKAWKLGLKSVALYRDQSKFVQPITHEELNKCPICGSKTQIESGCYRCTQCGFTSACVG